MFVLKAASLLCPSQEEVRPTTELVQSLIGTHATLDAKMAASKVSLFTDTAALTQEEVEESG